jgi:hypothetical protein
MLDGIERFDRSITSFHLLSYDQEGASLRLKAIVTFIDQSTLSIKEYVFADGQRKYAYHWMSPEGSLICRWDNARHYPEIPTFPNHKHLGNEVQESVETSVEDVLSIICEKISVVD